MDLLTQPAFEVCHGNPTGGNEIRGQHLLCHRAAVRRLSEGQEQRMRDILLLPPPWSYTSSVEQTRKGSRGQYPQSGTYDTRSIKQRLDPVYAGKQKSCRGSKYWTTANYSRILIVYGRTDGSLTCLDRRTVLPLFLNC
jgi:hypothetical protein